MTEAQRGVRLKRRALWQVALAATLTAILLLGAWRGAQAQTRGVRSVPGQMQPGAASGGAPLAKFEPAGDRVYHGASLPNTWDETGLRAQVQQYQKIAGKRLSVVTWFASLYEMGRMTSWRSNYASSLARVKRTGAHSLIKFSVQDYAYDRTKRIARTKDIALGVYDAYFEEFAATVRDFGDPVFISVNHEMNGNWYPYSEAYPNSGVTAADFVASWRRIVDIFRRQRADNVAWVWSPNVPDVGPVPFTKYYPGDEYVDWVGVSFYSGNPMSNLNLIYRTYAARKPIFVTEWATSPEKNQYYQGFPGEAKWIDMFFKALEQNYPRVKAISWFQWNKEDGNHLLQRVPEQAQVYNADIQNPRYLDTPGGQSSSEPRTELVTTQVVPKEIVLKEVAAPEAPRVVNPRPQEPPVERVPRQRIKLQIVPTQR